MQAYISTSRLVAFNIHPKQHNVMENQRIMRDEEKTVYIPSFLQQKEKQASALPMSFPPSLTLGNGSFFWAKTLYNSSLLLLLSLSGSSLVLLSKKNPPPATLPQLLFSLDFPPPSSLLQPPFFCWTPSAVTFLSAFFFLQPPFLSASCSFKKRGWFLMATKDVTRGHARWWHLSSISCKNDSQNGGLQYDIWKKLI